MSTTAHPSPLDRLFRPRSVAILGASDDPNRISGRPLRYIKEGGFKGGLYPINPNRAEVQGLKSYARLADLPEVPDVALLALPASATEQAVIDCVTAGVGAAVIFSAGYAEADEAGRACGMCDACRLRAEGFAGAGVADPTSYQSRPAA